MRKYKSLDIEEKLQIYNDVLNLRKEGFSYRKIQEIIVKKNNVKVDTCTMSLWLRDKNHPLRHYNKLIDGPELAYVISAWLGDGRLPRRKNRPERSVALPVKDYDFAEEWGRCLAKAFGKESPYKPRWDDFHRRWIAKACSKLLHQLLKKAKEDPWIVLPYLEKYPTDACRGFFDAEGGPIPDKYEIKAYNTDLRIIQLFKMLLERIGIRCHIREITLKEKHMRSPATNKVYRRNKQTCYELVIDGKENIMKFAEEIGSSIARKRSRLARLLERYNKIKIRKNHVEKCVRTLIAANLVRLGLIRSKTEAAKLLQISSRSISNYLNKQRDVSRLLKLPEIEELSKKYFYSRSDKVIKEVQKILKITAEIYNGRDSR